ncbi:14755_t:CDS:2, partial [Gigaspora rosea]
MIIKNSNNSTNVLAMCNWCIAKNRSLEVTKIKLECCTSNSLPVSKNKNKKQDTDDDNNSDILVPTLKYKKLSTTSKISRS